MLRNKKVISLWLAFFALLLWPGAVNGGAFLFPDTATYIRGADAAIFETTGKSSSWSMELFKRYPRAAFGTSKISTSSAGNVQEQPDNVILSGRSLYYGAPLYLSDALGSFWYLILAQAFVVATSIILALRRLDPAFGSSKSWIILAIPLLTPAGFFVAMMMPDFLAALAVIASAMMLLYWEKMARGERTWWFLLLVYGLVSHSANLLIVGGLLIAAILFRLHQKRWSNAGPMLVALVCGFLGEAIVSWGIKYAAGSPPVRPPFIMARLTADGPGTDYLNERCGSEARFVLCDYRSRLPIDSDVFLWSRTPEEGVFSAVPPGVQRQLSAEQSRFALAVIVDRPLEVLRTSTKAFLNQLSRTKLIEFNGIFVDRAKLPDSVAADFNATRAAQSRMPIHFTEAATPWLVLGSLLTGFVICWRERNNNDETSRRRFFLLLLLGVLLNAGVCGMLSKPHDRYQSRVLWLIPFAAAALLASSKRPAKQEASAPVLSTV